jgi:cell division protein FtsB
MALTVIDRWIKQINSTRVRKECDNRIYEEIENMKLRKENKRLLMENDILKTSITDISTNNKYIYKGCAKRIYQYVQWQLVKQKNEKGFQIFWKPLISGVFRRGFELSTH